MLLGDAVYFNSCSDLEFDNQGATQLYAVPVLVEDFATNTGLFRVLRQYTMPSNTNVKNLHVFLRVRVTAGGLTFWAFWAGNLVTGPADIPNPRASGDRANLNIRVGPAPVSGRSCPLQGRSHCGAGPAQIRGGPPSLQWLLRISRW